MGKNDWERELERKEEQMGRWMREKRRTYSGWTEREKQTGEDDRRRNRKTGWKRMKHWHWRRARLVDGRWGRAAGVKHSPQYPVDPGVIHARNSAI